MELTNKTAVITGGASGLGLAAAQQLVAAGANVVLFDINDDAASQAVEQLGEQAISCHVDVTDEASVTAGLDAAVQKFGAVHICVNCAGMGSAERTVGRNGPHALENFQRIIQLNLIGTFNVLRLAAERMSQHEPVNDDGERGVIVNTASIAAMDGQIGQVAYSASKGGVVGMTLPIARDLCKLGIRCNTIAPGIFKTPLVGMMPQEMQDGLAAHAQFPRRLGIPSEFGDLVVHIAENAYLNGETIRFDAGTRMTPK